MITRRALLSAIPAAAPFLERLQAQPPSEPTPVKLDLEPVAGTVNPMIFGQFIEYLGPCI